MGKALRDPLLLGWLALCAVTAVSLLLGGSGDAAASAAILAIAFAKAGVVMFLFMDLHRAPLTLRLLATGWLVLVLAGLIAVHKGAFG